MNLFADYLTIVGLIKFKKALLKLSTVFNHI